MEVRVADSRTYRSLTSIGNAVVRFGEANLSATFTALPLPNKIDLLLGTDFLSEHRATIEFGDGRANITIEEFSKRTPMEGTPTKGRLCYVDHGLTIEHVPMEEILKDLTDSNSPVLVVQRVTDRAPSIRSDHPHKMMLESMHSKHDKVFHPPKGVPIREGATAMRIPIKKGSRLPTPRQYHIPYHQQRKLAEWLAKAIERGWVEGSHSPVNTPAFLVPKPGRPGEFRTVLDFRAINSITEPEYQSAAQHANHLLEKLQSAKLLSVTDLDDGFFQLPVHPDDRYLTAFTIDGQQYQFTVAPQGLCGVPLAFQSEVNRILRKNDLFDSVQLKTVLRKIPPHLASRYSSYDPETVIGGVLAYVDDILAFTTEEDPVLHTALLDTLLEACRIDQLSVKPSKCTFMEPTVRFLGFVVGQGRLQTDPAKVEVIKRWIPPTTVTQVRSFLGFCNYFRRLIPSYAEITQPLTNLTRKATTFDWTASCQSAFNRLREVLCSAPVIILPDFSKPFVIVTDASTTAIGACLMQESSGERRPVAYDSRALRGAETNYSAQHLEALAVVWFVRKWRYYLWGSPFEVRILTDHRSLQHLRTQRDLQGRLARWQEILAEFDYRVEYLPGRANVLADALSRYPGEPQSTSVLRHLSSTTSDSQRSPCPDVLLARHILEVSSSADSPKQDNDAEGDQSPTPLTRDATARLFDNMTYDDDSDFKPIIDLLQYIAADDVLQKQSRIDVTQIPLKRLPEPLRQSLSKLQYYSYDTESRRLYNQSPTGKALVIPKGPLRRQLISLYHDDSTAAHRGARPTYLRLRRHFYWHRSLKDVDAYVRTCELCQRSKSLTMAKQGQLQSPGLPMAPYLSISMDFIMPLPRDPISGHDAILVVVDRFSKHSQIIPTFVSVTGQGTAELLRSRVFLEYGYPVEIICDRDPRFTGRWFSDFCEYSGLRG